jgi:hypothetical protein
VRKKTALRLLITPLRVLRNLIICCWGFSVNELLEAGENYYPATIYFPLHPSTNIAPEIFEFLKNELSH